jgi:DNA-binding CsgD family transcriptional regulator
VASALDRGRTSFERHAWSDAYAELSAANQEAPLEPDDLERLATAAYVVGREEESADLWARVHHELLTRGHTERAARCAFWLAFGLLNRGEHARGSGWIARARRLLDNGQRDCVEQGYLLLPVAIQTITQGDSAGAYTIFSQAAELGDRFGDPDLVALARHGCGRALIRLGNTAEGVALLDEVMVAVTAGELSPLVAGDVYCSVIEACKEIFDLRRAQEWTAALARWCESQPDLVLYRGQCLVYRAELMQLHGAWREAMDEARRAGEQLARPPGQPAVGAALYEQAELHRLRGHVTRAEEAYRQASEAGRRPEPGLALLRLAQGRVGVAAAAIRRVLDEAHDRVPRAKLLGAYVEIMLAAGDVTAARAGADELSEIAAGVDAPLLHALSTHATGAVLLADGQPHSALAALRRAWTAWHEIEAPYEAARARVLIARSCRALGDEDTATMELDAARWVFQQLGAAPDLAGVAALSRRASARAAGGLTAREVQVLRLVAAGKTNRAIAAQLFISEKTVARHVSNIFVKLGLSSRSAATAYAYEHELI